ncbi:phenylalanyl-tRNA synthetase beta subunit [Desulfocicer vacuolatum DSM 3385]|uniref:Phenylalanine--tRNA ligase beta subunit n=1 Tax=Desulfocicer vacuolatum DSM 3385 TaxID=1121400 RepID=A0A1W1ZV25_9BACT|nr:phenylalanine--tRNA ligase subunit beta [Desulfocicer vacuolatum]SMC52299.1 phenylalanyl-tRNA synthetase beta subunit [Desulfocicer vacuolatum DSM 3385]
MKVSLSWLKEYTSVTGDPAEIAAQLTMAGLEVEAVEDRYAFLDKVVVGRVETAEKHPDADRLSCCRVDVGEEVLSIVCGAPNVKAGLMVACACVGAELPGGFEIKKSKLRGATSQGMLCSSTELRLGIDGSGIMELSPDLIPGTPLANALDLSDVMFDIDLTPNRPDCLSIIGVAREVAAVQCIDFNPRLPIPLAASSEKENVSELIDVEIHDPNLCPRYMAGMVMDVKVGPSPYWLRDRLESVGLTPINNIVDVTNFVMMETGQPLHAFDYDFLTQKRIEVRRAGTKQDFVTLDGKTHTLDPDMLVICDGKRPVALAGVMGGENSEIIPETTRVLVESAYFDPVSVRRTAKLCGINSDASHRFERGVDPEGCARALSRAVSLMVEVSGATLVPGVVDAHPTRFDPVVIELNTGALNRRLGTDLDDGKIAGILESVGFVAKSSAKGMLTVDVPSFRVDVARPEDLSEEVARLWGYDNIKTSFPMVPSLRQHPVPAIEFRESVKDMMNGFGFFEAVNYSFTDAGMCGKLQLAPEDQRWAMEKILNPISEEMSVLRSSLLPGLLETMGRNVAKQTDTLRIFEVGKMFLATSPGTQPREQEMLAALWTGNRFPSVSWHGKAQPCDFFDLKGIVQGLLDALDIPASDLAFTPASENAYPYFKKGCGAVVKKGEACLGALGEVAPTVCSAFGLKQSAFVFELDMTALLLATPQAIVAQPLPRFPSVERDITMIVDEGVAAGDVCDDLLGYTRNNSLVEDLFLFDVYQGAPLAEGQKSLSFRIVYRSAEKTLKEKKIKGLHANISGWLIKRYDAALPA